MFESGTYFFVGANGSYTESLTAMTETIHPMAPEFLPAGVGGGVQVVTLTQDESGWTSSHTGAQIAEMVEKGLVIGKRTIDGQPAMYFPFSGMNGGIAFFSQTIMQGSAAMTLVIGVPANDTVCTMGTMQ